MQGRYTPFEVQNIMQAMTMQVLNTSNYGDVRISWQTQGQPAWKVSDDKVFISAIQVDDAYSSIRDVKPVSNYDDTHVLSTSTYVRVWQVDWCCVGPKSFDAATDIKSALFNAVFLDPLSLQGLYPVTDYGVPIRAPELFDGQWWERVDFKAKFNELVTEDFIESSIGSADIFITKENGITAEVKVP